MTAETETCQELMRRVPRSVEGMREDHPILSVCGRPVEADGLCGFHLRRRDADPDLARTIRLARAGRR